MAVGGVSIGARRSWGSAMLVLGDVAFVVVDLAVLHLAAERQLAVLRLAECCCGRRCVSIGDDALL